MARRESGCPLCGARLRPQDLLDTCDDVVDATLGVLAGCCPHCQGRLEVRPRAGYLELGYLTWWAGVPRFDVAVMLPWDGLELLPNGPGLTVANGDCRWTFG